MENSKKVPIKIIRYEDLLNSTYAVFLYIIKFIKKNNNINKILKK